MPIDGAPEDTICAIATPMGEGGIGVVRISGSLATHVAGQVVRLRVSRSLQTLPSHTLHLADIVSPHWPEHISGSRPATVRAEDLMIDEGLVVYMKAPHSFTAEDVVEIHCHGSNAVLQRVCESCVAAGARLAQPGEFTKRAFLNGRLDLSQAEAVLDTIKAKSELALALAQRQLRGDLGRQVARLRTCLLSLQAQVEAGIDFTEEDISFVTRDELTTSLQDTADQIRKMLATAETGRAVRDGVRIVIVGRPNVGKSSLLNSLIREDRAIVTDIPGTTRDIIEESVTWNGLHATLVDTAGLRDTVDVVEQEGIRRALDAQLQGDMVLHVVDAAEVHKIGVQAFSFPDLVREDLVVFNKIDLVGPLLSQTLADSLADRTNRKVLPISIRTGEGLEELKQAIESRFLTASFESNEGVVITNLRHRVALEHALASIDQTLTSIRGGAQAELLSVDLHEASDSLGEIIGTITSDDVLERIFAEFCIGK